LSFYEVGVMFVYKKMVTYLWEGCYLVLFSLEYGAISGYVISYISYVVYIKSLIIISTRSAWVIVIWNTMALHIK